MTTQKTTLITATIAISMMTLAGCATQNQVTQTPQPSQAVQAQKAQPQVKQTVQQPVKLDSLLSWANGCGDNSEYVNLVESVFGDYFPSEMKTLPHSQWLVKYNPAISSAKAYEKEENATFHLVINFQNAIYQGIPVDKVEHFFSYSEYTGDVIQFNQNVPSSTLQSKFKNSASLDINAKTITCMPEPAM